MRVALLTGGMKAAARRTTLSAIRNDEADLVVGTHALMSEGVENLPGWVWRSLTSSTALGCVSAAHWQKKAANPHLLVMSATPIPRTLGLLIYGDLDISILDELPSGRTPVKTRCITGKRRRDLYPFSGQRDRQGAAGVSGLPRHRGCAGRRAECRQELLRGHCQGAAARTAGWG